jgi:predicted nucleic acid-binding protein
MKVLVDSNVLLDIFTEDPQWGKWSASMIEKHAERDILVINQIVYAEISLHFSTIEELDEALPNDDFERQPLPWEAAFLAGRCFLEYRRKGGARTSPMPDFYIGAHAAIQGLPVLTRDPRRFRSYFPRLKLISP